MKGFNFEKNLNHQSHAVESSIAVFENISLVQPTEADKINRIGQLRQGVIKVIENSKFSPDVLRKYTVADMITGYGVAESVRHFYDIYGGNVAGKKAIVQGFGNVGSFTAKHLQAQGAKIVAIALRDCALYNKDGIDFLKRTSKRIRKYNGSLIVSTQNMIDFTADEIKRYGQVIVDNSAYICLMAQGNKELEALKEMMKLSDSETNFLSTASRGDMLFVISQDTRIPIKIFLRDDEKELFGTGGGR